MNDWNTRRERRPSAAEIARTCDPTRLDRVLTGLAWYAPELIAAGVAAGLALTAWRPLLAVTVAVLVWIAVDRVLAFRRTRAIARLTADQARLDRAADTGPATGPPVDEDDWTEVVG